MARVVLLVLYLEPLVSPWYFFPPLLTKSLGISALPHPDPVLFHLPVPVAYTVRITLWLVGFQLFKKMRRVSLAWTLAVSNLS